MHRDGLFAELTERIIGCAMEVHSELGPGLLESTYLSCLSLELSRTGIQHQTEVALPVNYKGSVLPTGYRIDMLVEDSIIVELKASETLLPVHEAQLITYLKLSGLHIGLLINFNVKLLKQGLRRIAL